MLQFSLSKAYLHKAHQLVVLLEDYDFDQTQNPIFLAINRRNPSGTFFRYADKQTNKQYPVCRRDKITTSTLNKRHLAVLTIMPRVRDIEVQPVLVHQCM